MKLTDFDPKRWGNVEKTTA